jgi:pimeloyl-ACP methyl ester carboxylesterase
VALLLDGGVCRAEPCRPPPARLSFDEVPCHHVGVTYVLVHGGGFAGSCWDELCLLLDRPVLAVDLPGRGSNPGDLSSLTVADFVASVAAEIVRNDLTDVTLVGHSLAGLTLPGVVEAVSDRLRRVVFVSCSVPPHGVALADVLEGFSPSAAAIAQRLDDELVDASGLLHPDLARVMFCNDMDDEQTTSTLGRRVPEALGVLSEPTDLTGMRRPTPRTYVRLTHDAIVSLETQDQMIENLGGAELAELDAGHMAMISRPHDLAALLNHL